MTKKKTAPAAFLIDGAEKGLKSKRIGRFWYRPLIDSTSHLPVVYVLDLGEQSANGVLKRLNQAEKGSR